MYYSYQREYRKNNVNKMRLEHKTARNKSVENFEDEISKFIVSQGYRNYERDILDRIFRTLNFRRNDGKVMHTEQVGRIKFGKLDNLDVKNTIRSQVDENVIATGKLYSPTFAKPGCPK